MTFGAFAEGVAIIAKYERPGVYSVRAEHDQLWIGYDELSLSEADKARMLELGWMQSDEGGWSCYT